MEKISFHIAKRDRPIIFLSGLFMGIPLVDLFLCPATVQCGNSMLSNVHLSCNNGLVGTVDLKNALPKNTIFVLGLLVLAGIYLLAPDFDIGNSHVIAVGLGVFSAVVYAIRNIILKSRAAHYNGSLMMTYQTGIVGFILAPVFLYIMLKL